MTWLSRRLSLWWRWRRRRLLQLWGAGIAASVVVTLASSFGYLGSKRASSLDILVRLRGQRTASSVAIAAVDDQAFRSLGQRQPLPRDYLAKVVRGLQRSGAAVAALDITLTSATSPEADAALAEAIREFSDGGVSRVVLPCAEPPGSGRLADPALLNSIVCGRIEIPEDDDGGVRRARLLRRDGTRLEPSLALAAVARLGGMDPRTLGLALRDSPVMLALPRLSPEGKRADRRGDPLRLRPDELIPINFLGPAATIPTFPSDTLARIGESGEVATDNPFRDRVVLVGGTFEEGRDFFSTAHGRMPGVEVHGNIIHMLLTRDFIQPPGWIAGLAMQVATTLVIGVILVVSRPWVGTLVCVATPFVVGIPMSYLLFHQGGYWVDFVLPMAAVGFMRKGANALERRRASDVFGRCLAREMAVVVGSKTPNLAGEHRAVTILFSGLRDISALAGGLAPEQVTSQLNQYADAMAGVIFQFQGMVYDFAGDGILAVFGAPLEDPDHALHATQAALAMEEALRRLRERWDAAHRPLLAGGLGIHTTRVFAGYVGGRMPLRYTILGDEVGLASRVERLNEVLGTTILLTEETQRLLGDGIALRDCGEIPVSGWPRPVRLFTAKPGPRGDTA